MRIAFVTDTHFGPQGFHEGKLRKLTQHAARLTREFVTAMNEREKPDFVVNLGDVIEDQGPSEDARNYREFVDILSALDAPLLHVAGNHDQVHLSRDALATLWSRTGELHYARDLGDLRALVLRTDHTDRDVRLEAAQIDWLGNQLEQASRPCLVLIHHPLCEMDVSDNVWFRNQPNICRVAERRRIRSLLEASGKVVAVFNGHVHWNYLSVIAGIGYVTVQSLTENVEDDAPGRPAGAYAVADFVGRQVSVRVMGAEPAHYRLETPPR
jgi:3',5'-cyclic AMP phosphodiesterase CpdA